MRYGSLCSGIGGLDLAVERVFGATPAWFCETDVHASRVLAAHWPGVPIYPDLTTQDWTTVEPVELVAAGFPCQDISYVGRGAGINGTRSGLWFDVLHAVSVLQPRWVVLENVGALRRRGLNVVAHGLASLGFVGRWGTVRASDAGCCHRRERVFIVADSGGARFGEHPGGSRAPVAYTAESERATPPDPADIGRERGGAAR